MKYIRFLKINEFIDINQLKSIKIRKLDIDLYGFTLEKLLDFYNDYLKNNLQDKQLCEYFGDKLYDRITDYQGDDIENLLYILSQTEPSSLNKYISYNYDGKKRFPLLEKKGFIQLIHFYNYLKKILSVEPSLSLEIPQKIFNNYEKIVYDQDSGLDAYIALLKKYFAIKYPEVDISKDGMDIIKKEHPLVYDTIFSKKYGGHNVFYKHLLALSDKPLSQDEEKKLYERYAYNQDSVNMVLKYISNNIKKRDFNFENKYLFNEVAYYFIIQYIVNIVFDLELKNKEPKNLKTINDEFKINNLKDKINQTLFSKEDISKIIEYEIKKDNFKLTHEEYDEFFKTNFQKTYERYFKKDPKELKRIIDSYY